MLSYIIIIFSTVVLHHHIAVNGYDDICQGISCNLEQQYCTGKICLDHSRCIEDADCLNESNEWIHIMCVGPITCAILSDVEGESGYCSKSCDMFCETGKDCGELHEQQYCGGKICLDHTTCRGDKDCLESSNIWFQPECVGLITCEDGSCSKSCDMFCETGKDCGEQQYCGGNVCRDHTACQRDLDCLNPSNEWIAPKCIGVDKCQDGSCHRTCGYQCEDKSEPVSCFDSPCEGKEKKCDDRFSCIDDYCGGCNAIVFDTAGNEVCLSPSSSPITISSTSESPTPAPNQSVCVDDPIFRHQKKKKKSCKWIGKNEKRINNLCEKKKVYDACKIVCGRCCADDMTRTFKVEEQELTCGWLRQEARKKEQCTRPEVNSVCAAKCGRCCSNDQEFTFYTYGNPKLKKCGWLKKKSRVKWCKQEHIAAACQKSCDSCEDYTRLSN